MKKVLRSNTYFLIIILLQLFLPIHLIFKWFNINDLDNVLIEPKEIKDILKNNKNHIVDGF